MASPAFWKNEFLDKLQHEDAREFFQRASELRSAAAKRDCEALVNKNGVPGNFFQQITG